MSDKAFIWKFAAAINAADPHGHWHGWYTNDGELPSGWVDGHSDSVAEALMTAGWTPPGKESER